MPLKYFTTFITNENATESEARLIDGLNKERQPFELNQIRLHCQELRCKAELFDKEGNKKGRINDKGEYLLG
jgi:hypothetical protein